MGEKGVYGMVVDSDGDAIMFDNMDGKYIDPIAFANIDRLISIKK